MDLGALLLLLAVILLVGIFISRPFSQKTDPLSTGTPEEGQLLSSLMAERDRVINTLQELDFDYKLGKIPAAEYPAIRSDLLKKGSDVLRQLDTLQKQGISSLPQPNREDVFEKEQIESITTTPLMEDEVEKLIAARRSAHQEKAGGFCPNCGNPVLKSDRFCPRCGAALKS